MLWTLSSGSMLSALDPLLPSTTLLSSSVSGEVSSLYKNHTSSIELTQMNHEPLRWNSITFPTPKMFKIVRNSANLKKNSKSSIPSYTPSLLTIGTPKSFRKIKTQMWLSETVATERKLKLQKSTTLPWRTVLSSTTCEISATI